MVGSPCRCRRMLLGSNALCVRSCFPRVSVNLSTLTKNLPTRTAGRKHTLEDMTLSWALPVVTLIVASSAGAEIASALQKYSQVHAIITVSASVIALAIGLVLSSIILNLHFQRLFFVGLPEGPGIMTVFFPLGPVTKAGLASTFIGEYFEKALPFFDSSSPFLRWPYTGQVIYVFCVCISFLLWALGTMCLFFAILGIVSTLRKTRIPYALSFWGLIFPNGNYATLTIILGRTLNATFFRVWGAMYAAATILMWLLVTCRSLRYMYDVVFNELSPTITLSQSPTLQEMGATSFGVEKE
ncbi:hypothetical protein AX15_004538 [Amanita polypyramis BW_CC]|nr:hypothetical protein AX15_004538 [Amanita polypyramis BW_CC]